MNMARILLITALLLAAPLLSAADESLADLRREQRELAATMHQKRVELLEKDEALKELHRKVMALHRELALRLDNHRDLRDLVKRLRDLETRIRRQEEDAKPAEEITPAIPPAADDNPKN